ncbi:MAG: transporter, partial [Eudoraea sp.]|nr:transporter [Eudoraea sp.]
MKFSLFFLFTITISLLNAQENPTLVSHLEIYSLETGKRSSILTEKAHFEAPNWSRDGSYLLINQEGKLYRVYLDD